MSFNAKNLTYGGRPPFYNLPMVKLTRPVELNEPSFLRKLKGQYSGGDVRHERPLARPKRHKGDDEEDAPTYVVKESHDTMTQSEYEALLDQMAPQKRNEQTGNSPSRHEDSTEQHANGDEISTQNLPNVKQQIASIGASTKRKSVKIVGDDDLKDVDSRNVETSAAAKTMKKPMKKPKKRVKLSFDGDVAEG